MSAEACATALMNAYIVSAGQVDVIQEYIGGYPRKEPEYLVDLVFAPNRGAAKSTFAKAHREIEFTDIKHVIWIEEGVKRERGIARSDDALWDHVPADLALASVYGVKFS